MIARGTDLAPKGMAPCPPAGPLPTARRAASTACAHCGEPCGEDALGLDDGTRFCCPGCRAVWSMICGCGLDDYYRLRAIEGGRGARGRSAERRRLELDSEAFLAGQSELLGPQRRRITLGLDGLRCGACLWLIESMPRLLPGVLASRVDAGRSTIEIDWDPDRVRLSDVAQRLERLGYEVLPLRDRRERSAHRTADHAWLMRLGVSAVISANTMGIAFALYGGLMHGMDPVMRAFLQWTSLALAVVSVLGPGQLFLRNAWLALRSRVPHVDLPISLALVAALLGGAWSTARGGDGVYAESLSMLVMLLLAGRFVQFRSQRRAREQVELIAALLPGAARRLRADGSIEEVSIDALMVGDRVIVPAGEVAPADGTVVRCGGIGVDPAQHRTGSPVSAASSPGGPLSGSLWADLQALTGESRPVEIAIGERCWAGARLLSGPVELEVEAAGAESRMGRIRALVEHAAARRAPIVEFANRIAGWFLLAVAVLALLNLALWIPIDPSQAIEHTVALLVVTCPCVLGLATPLAIVASLAKAARVGILIKGGDVLERLGEVGTIVLDKTGTLTEGNMRVECVEGDTMALHRAAELERQSAHPLARAVVAWSDAAHGRAIGSSVLTVIEHAGRGVRGEVDGCPMAIGRLDFVLMTASKHDRGPRSHSERTPAGEARERYLDRDGDQHRDAERWGEVERRLAAQGLTPIAVACGGAIVTMFGVGDAIRSESAEVIASLRRSGWRVAIASGDSPGIVSSVASRVGVDADLAFGSVTPEAKLELIERLRREKHGPLLMVGDGVNDVAAMAGADVGIALGSGTRASLEVGDACLARQGIGALPQLLEGARRTHRVIRVNFALSLVYNLAGATLAMLGVMNPLIAAVLMPISGLTVTAVALKATHFDASRRHRPADHAPR